MNREITSSLWPLTGDVDAEAGNTLVRVIGIQGRTVDNPTLFGGEHIAYDPVTNHWIPFLEATIQVNGMTVSDDPYISVNVPKPVLVNGS